MSRGSRSGQIGLEYFLIAAGLAAITLIGFAILPDALKDTLGRFIDSAAENFAH